MKRKIIFVLMLATLLFALAMAASAAHLADFATVELELTDGTKTTAYMKKGSIWEGYQGYDRATLYADYTDDSQKISWSDVVVFDGRNTEICTFDGTTLTRTGTYPQTLLGHPASPKNVTHVYYSQGATCIADTSFPRAKGWAVEYLWVPNTVEYIGKNACDGLNMLKEVEFEEGSQLKRIGYYAFSSTSLSSFELNEGLTRIEECAFYNTHIEGTVIIPNSVTFVGAGAYRKTKVETIVYGDGAIEILYNAVGDSDLYKDCLKNIYLPAEAVYQNSRISEIWFSSNNIINFYIVADAGQDTTAAVNALKSTGRVKFATQEEIENGTAVAGYNAVIITGVSKCDAFYGGEHVTGEASCTRCGTLLFCTDTTHNLETDVVYSNGYHNEGVKYVRCLDCGTSPTMEEAKPLFSCRGYSVYIAGNGSVSLLFLVDLEEIESFEQATGKAVEYGVFAALGDTLGNGDVFENGEAKKGVITKDVTEKGITAFELKITGFEAEAQMSALLALGAYVKTTKDGESAYSYMQSSAPANGAKYVLASYNDIAKTLAQ